MHKEHQMSISLPPKGNDAKVLGAYFSPLKVQAQAIPGMTVKVAEGSFWTADNEYKEYIGGSTPTISAAFTGARWVLITVTDNGVLRIVYGDIAASPVLPLPDTYKDELPLAAIFLTDTTTAITNEMIFDLRPMWSVPVDAISQAQLDDYATIVYVDNQVAAKADVDGTPSTSFTLGTGISGVNNASFDVNRFGALPDVAIRFNEFPTPVGSPLVAPDPRWEFTNDGSTWDILGVSDDLFYTKVAADARFAPIVHTHVTTDITDITATFEEINALVGIGVGSPAGSITVQSQLDDKVNLAGDTMDSAADLTFVGGGQVLGLPAVPVGLTAAASKAYVDATTSSLATHVSDFTVHLTADQNTFLDALTLTGSPALAAADVNHLIGITGNVQTLLDGKSDTGHTHVAADVTDFDTAVGTYVSGTMVLDDVSDVTSAGAVSGEILVFNGAVWNNATFLSTAGTDFVRKSGSIAESITGVKTFSDAVAMSSDLIITGDLTVNGTTTTIDATNLAVSDKNITVNAGYVGAPVGSTGSGLHVDRGFGGSPMTDFAVLTWNEANQRWEGGITGSETAFAVEGQTLNQPFYELLVGVGGSPAQATYAVGFDVPMPAAGAAGVQVFVNGIKQVEGAGKAFTTAYGVGSPSHVEITFTSGSEPTTSADIEVYGFGYIG
jgi:hypothetical protein